MTDTKTWEPKIAIVLPTNRPEQIPDWIDSWRPELSRPKVDLYVVEDNATRSISLPSGVKHFCYDDFEELPDPGIIPKHTDCVRSFGFWRAYQDGAEVIMSFDDDVIPCGGQSPVDRHILNLSLATLSPGWTNTLSGAVPRGVPFESTERISKTMLSHGTWNTVPDFDAITQLVGKRTMFDWEPRKDLQVPVGSYFPMCGMNIAFRRELTPAMYFLLMGPDYPFDRWGDIWAGLMAKKICDYLGYGVKSGDPILEHKRASNVWANLKKESPGYPVNEELWRRIDAVRLNGVDVQTCYWQLAQGIDWPDAMETDGYADTLRRAMVGWADLFSDWSPKKGK